VAKLLIKNGLVVTVDSEFNIYPSGAVYIEDDRIIEVNNSAALEQKIPGCPDY